MAASAAGKRRLQANAACEGCRKRKIRCDSVRPRCSNCQIRDTPCEYTSPSPASKRSRPSGSVIASPHVSTVGEAATGDVEQTFLGPSTTFAFVTDCAERGPNGAHPACQSPSLPRLDSVDYSVGNTTTPQAAQPDFQLPHRAAADRLVDRYFRGTHIIYPILHEGTFRAEYEAFWGSLNRSEHNARPSWYALLNAVFAHADGSAEPLDDRDSAIELATLAGRSQGLILHHALKSGTLELVQSMLLLCYYLQSTTKLEECWNLSGLMIRTATSLGLNLSLQPERHLPIEKELRKRVWWGCYILDQSISMQLGRSPTLGSDSSQVDLPLEVDDIYMSNDAIIPTQPSVIPSMVSFFVALIKLSTVVSSMLEQLYLRDHTKYSNRAANVLEPPYSRCHYILSKVVLLDGKLQSWWAHTPVHLKQTIQDNYRGQRNTQLQRAVLRLRFLHVRLLLHRQTLLYFTRHEIQDDFCRSIAASSTLSCLDCAHDTINLVQTARREQSSFSLPRSAQYIFTSMCILHILEKVVDSRSSHLQEHDSFRKRREDYDTGMELLLAASTSNSLAARYVHILQRLSEEHAQNNTSGGSAESIVPALNGEIDESSISQAPGTQQYIAPSQFLNWGDMGNEFRFNDIDNLLFEAGFWDPLSSTALDGEETNIYMRPP